ncbi:MAG TPA: hypothetical protein PKH31_06525 [Candidatus Sumerlaeota bacterium]|nr:hypothetical protein [Candidatus Sumerlaeota bacterium]
MFFRPRVSTDTSHSFDFSFHLIGISLFFLLLLSSSGFSDTTETYTIKGRVLGLDGKPAPGVEVKLIGTSRSNVLETKTWSATTNQEGCFWAMFWKFDLPETDTTETLPENDKNIPTESTLKYNGNGQYHFFVPPSKKHAGAIGPEFWVPEADDYVKKARPNSRLQCPTSVTLQLVPGIPVQGIVSDLEGKALAGVKVTVYNDFHADTHTGAGGEACEQVTQTDAEGKYRFAHVNPGTSIRLRVEGVCLRTRTGRDKEWVDNWIDEFDVDKKSPSLNVDFVASLKKDNFKVQGTVTDENGKPIDDAEVKIGYAYRNNTGMDADHRQYKIALTNAQGQYECALETPWVTFVDVAKEGFDYFCSEGEEDEAERKPIPVAPKRFDVVMKKAGSN